MAVVPLARDPWTDYHLVLINTHVLLVFFSQNLLNCAESKSCSFLPYSSIPMQVEQHSEIKKTCPKEVN